MSYKNMDRRVAECLPVHILLLVLSSSLKDRILIARVKKQKETKMPSSMLRTYSVLRESVGVCSMKCRIWNDSLGRTFTLVSNFCVHDV